MARVEHVNSHMLLADACKSEYVGTRPPHSDESRSVSTCAVAAFPNEASTDALPKPCPLHSCIQVLEGVGWGDRGETKAIAEHACTMLLSRPLKAETETLRFTRRGGHNASLPK